MALAHFFFSSIYKNMKNMMTILIVISVAFTSALFFAASGAATTTEQISITVKTKYVGSADIVIEPNNQSENVFFDADLLQEYRNDLQYFVKVIEGNGFYIPDSDEYLNIIIRGITYEDMMLMNHVEFVAHEGLPRFEDDDVIISELFADKNALSLGDDIEVEINGRRKLVTIVGIAKTMGPFMDDGQATFVVIPYNSLAHFLGYPDKANRVYVKVLREGQMQEIMHQLSAVFFDYTVREAITQEEIHNDVSRYTDPYMLIEVVVLILCIFVIYSCFKVITFERLPFIGTLRSIGATNRMTNLLLLTESALYGVVGGALGCVIGIGLLQLILTLSLPEYLSSIDATMVFTQAQIIQTFALAVFTCVISSALPIVQVRFISIKDVIYNTITREKEDRKLRSSFIALFLVVFALFLSKITPPSWALPVNLLSIMVAMVSAIALVPLITRLAAMLAGWLSDFWEWNVLRIAAQNLKGNKINNNSITLLAISIAVFVLINTLNYSINREMKDLFRNNALFDVFMIIDQAGDRLQAEQDVRAIQGVDDVYTALTTYGLEILGTRIDKVGSVDPELFLQYWDLSIIGNKREILSNLCEGRNILLTTLIRDKFNLEINDVVTLNSANHSEKYTVAGFFSSYNSGGSYALIPEIYFKEDFDENTFLEVCVMTSWPDMVVAELKKKNFEGTPYIFTMTEYEELNYETYKSLFLILRIFAMMCLAISVLGIFNNLIISMLQKRRILAVMRSIGMSRSQTVSATLIEAILCGLVGSGVGILCSVLVITLLPRFMMAINQITPVHYDPWIFLYALLAGIVLTTLASIRSAIYMSKIVIVQALKYE